MNSDNQSRNLSEGCHTCLAIPGKIIAISSENSDSALVDVAGMRRNVDLALIQDSKIAPGDWVLIHVGFAMSIISEDEALRQWRLLEILGQTGVVREICGSGLADEDDAPLPPKQEQSQA
jgi:hydrogenase expression/formation protein HypC